jgi:hypothetical protein
MIDYVKNGLTFMMVKVGQDRSFKNCPKQANKWIGAFVLRVIRLFMANDHLIEFHLIKIVFFHLIEISLIT